MPAAVVDMNSTQKFDLKSAPPDGYVILRKMTYGQKLTRQQNAMKIQMEMQRRGKGTTKANMEMESLASALFDFKNCVVEHNLTDATGNLLNLSTDFDVTRLDPRVGEEISTYIDEMNNFEPEDDKGNSGTE
jgi:hypothetical protein